MRKEILNSALGICAIAPLLAGCGAPTAGGTVEVPMSCPTAGQVLTTDSTGQFQCVSLPAGVVTIPKCDPNFQALTTDGMTLSCTSRNNETTQSQQAIMNLEDVESKIINYGTTVTMLGMGGMGAKALFQGVTTGMYNGSMSANGMTGLASATALCGAQFGTGAHMCTVYEMYDSVAYAGQISADKFNPTQAMAQAWVYMMSWKNPGTTATPTTTPVAAEANAGLADNCGSYTDDGTHSTNFYGTQVSWSKVNTGFNGLQFNSGPAALCSSLAPISCCK
jgi:hypothetical protein